ncbi:MAG: hypothetical protein RMK98_04205 [Bacteroidia bacterium]|nr:hypothetical protein [Bacteroidia bacterium]
MKSLTQKYNLWLLLGMLALSIYWEYPKILKHPPRGPHIWRQTYTLAFTLAFYEDNLYPLQPRNYNMEYANNTTDHYLIEFPIIPYVNALIWKLTQPNEITPRLLTFTLTLIGFVFLRMTLALFVGELASLILTLFLWCTPIYGYYSINYLIDPAAHGLAHIGMYYLVRTLWFGENHWGKVALWYSIASLIKIMSLYSYLVLMTGYFLSHLIERRTSELSSRFRMLTWLSIPLLITVLWYYIIRPMYLVQVDSVSFLFLELDNVQAKLREVVRFYSKQFFPMPLTYATLLLSIAIPLGNLLLGGKKVKNALIYLLINCAAIIAYHIAWFRPDHDYYYTVDYEFLALLWVIGFKDGYFLSCAPSTTKLTYAIATIFLVVSAESVKRNVGMRYGIREYEELDFFSTKYEVGIFWWHNAEEWDRIYKNFLHVRQKKLNEKLSIPKDALILCMPDHTPCGCLYFIQRRGWSDAYGKLGTPELIEDKIKRGAQFVFIGNTELVPKEHPIWRYTRDTLYSEPPLMIMRLGLPAKPS